MISELICRLRGHKADPAAIRWNQCICFGKCARCGRDLVRTVNSFWQVPRGYKVVWRPMPKESLEPAQAEAEEWPEPQEQAPLEWDQPFEPEYAGTEEAEPATPSAREEPHSATAQAPQDDPADIEEWPVRAPPARQHLRDFSDEEAASPPSAVEAPSKPASERPLFRDFMDEDADDGWGNFEDCPLRSTAGTDRA